MPRGDPVPFPSSVGYAYSWAGRPRRMARAEIVLWHWFVNKYPSYFDRVWFDVMIPSDMQALTPDAKCPLARDAKWPWVWDCLTCLRADVVARKGLTYQVVELRSQPLFATMGMALRLTEYFTNRYPTLKWSPPMVICDDLRLYIKLDGDYAKITLINRSDSGVSPKNKHLEQLFDPGRTD